MIKWTSGIAFAVALLASGAAFSHAYIQVVEAPAGYKQDIEIRVPHGCKGSSTTQVRVKLPDGVTAVRPEYDRQWKIDIKMRKLPKPVRGEGGVMLGETVDEITWSGNTLPDLFFERFTMRVSLPNEPGRMLWFKTIQVCEKGENRWVDVPADGENLQQFFRTAPGPAPFVKLIKADRPQYPF